jgi:hypothetical protein
MKLLPQVWEWSETVANQKIQNRSLKRMHDGHKNPDNGTSRCITSAAEVTLDYKLFPTLKEVRTTTTKCTVLVLVVTIGVKNTLGQHFWIEMLKNVTYSSRSRGGLHPPLKLKMLYTFWRS